VNIQLKERSCYFNIKGWAGASLLTLIFLGSGCATTHRTTVTETTLEYPNEDISQMQESGSVENSSNGTEETVVERKTTTTTTDIEPKRTGILGGIFNVIGSIVSFPFVVIGGLFRMIF
jgi:hypothetical protein